MYVRLRKRFTFWSDSEGLTRLKDFPAGPFGRCNIGDGWFEVRIFDAVERHVYVCTPDAALFDVCVKRITPLEALTIGVDMPTGAWNGI